MLGQGGEVGAPIIAASLFIVPSQVFATMPSDQRVMHFDWLQPQLGSGCQALFSTRAGGVSEGAYAHLNLGDHVGDELAAVQTNRRRFEAALGSPAVWLRQVHGHQVVRLGGGVYVDASPPIEADGAISADPGVACVVMVADCLPILLAAPEGRGVGALHAGWRGLAGAGSMGGRGIVDTGVPALCELAGCDPADLHAWLGPCIGPKAFEVGGEVLEAFGAAPTSSPLELPAWCRPSNLRAEPSEPPRWLVDLQAVARLRLQACGVHQIGQQPDCTVSAPGRYFSFRRDGVTGRMAAGIVCRA